MGAEWWGRQARKRLPIVTWLPKYNKEKAVSDLIAGLTVGLTVMPQGLAYASIAGLETQYGLYSAFMGCIVYVVLGGCKDITIGPTALLSLMTYQQVVDRNPDYAVLLCFLTGCVLILMAPLRLGVLVEFISEPVTVGFTSATAIIIVGSQAKSLLGISYSSSGFLDNLLKLCQNIGDTRPADAVLGLSCLIILLAMRKLKDIKVWKEGSKPTNGQRALAKGFWLLSLSRNALVVFACSVLAYCLHDTGGHSIFTLTGHVTSGLPPFRLPPFSSGSADFFEMVSDLGSSIVLVPIIAVLGNVAIAKAFAGGGGVDATQELLALGFSNMVGSFFSSIPVTGSFSRSAVNHASGVSTPMGGLYTGGVILLALGVLTQYFYFIPKACLAAVIITAVIFMIEYEAIRPLWRSSKLELVPLGLTFIMCLAVGVEYGILVGVLANLALIFSHSARPSVSISVEEAAVGVEYRKVIPSGSVYCCGVGGLRKTISRFGVPTMPIVLDCTHILRTDYTTAKEVKSIMAECARNGQAMFLYNAKEPVLSVFLPICGKGLINAMTEAQLRTLVLDHHKMGSGNEDSTVIRLPTVELKQTNGGTTQGKEILDHADQPLLEHKTQPRIISGGAKS